MKNNSKKWWKIGGMAIVVLAVAGGAWSFYKINWPPLDFDPENFNELIKNAKSPEQIVEYTHLMQEAYKNDPYGGATPEETLNLFVEALKRGDTDLASRYFVIDKRVEIKTSIENSRKNGVINTIVQYMEQGIKKEVYSSDKKNYEVSVYGEGEKIPFVFRLVRNDLNGKWLIEDF